MGKYKITIANCSIFKRARIII